MTTGYVHSFETMATKDGDGIRFAAFLSGCPLRCAYCHNVDVCVEEGKEITPAEFVNKAARYKEYFADGGGVTFSGGEPLLQAEFVYETGKRLLNEGINYTLDTSGAVALTESVKAAVNNAELIILDLKFFCAETYKKYTGGDIALVYEFLRYLSETKKRFWLRTVIVPSLNDDKKSIECYADTAKKYGGFEKYQLLAFHTLGFSKYENLKLSNPLKGVAALSGIKLNELQNHLNVLLNG